MSTPRDVLTPTALAMLQTIAHAGSFAAAARATNMVPSALTYRVRAIEDALDVLLFDRSSRQAKLTDAGAELLREAGRLLADIDAVANRVRRVATGWEAQLTISVDSIINRTTLMEMCEAFFALNPPTRLKLQTETLSGTLEALTSGRADLALGVVLDATTSPGLHRQTLGSVGFVFAVGPNHPLALAAEPLSDAVISKYRAVALADSVERGGGLNVGVLAGQDVFTVTDMREKVDAHIRGLGVGFLPKCLAQPYIETGRLLAKRVQRAEHELNFCYAWRSGQTPAQGRALHWWLRQIDSPLSRAALLSGSRVASTDTPD